VRDFQGILQAGAYSGFNALYESGRVVEAACWKHARRYFHDEMLANGSPIAREAIERMGPLFAIEAEIHGQPPEARLAARQARSAPVMADLHAWLEATLRRISGKSDLAKAIRYALAQWDALTTVLRDGRACLHNNAAERRMRPLALGRKNYLFAGSLEGGRRAAIIYTLVGTAEFNGWDPQAYAPGRGAEHAKALLAGYRGILQCDGYAAYKTLAAAGSGITLAFCWSHVQREFIELAKGKTPPIATETLQRIAALYAIETDLRGKPPDLRRAGRQARSHPLVEDLFAWLSAQLARLPGGSPTAQAIRYTLNHRDGLVRFLDHGRIELDNNTVERAIRPICLSRKNALFASGDDGGARWAAVASLVETCKLNGVDPQRYFTDVLTRLVNGWPNSSIDELMPWCWADADKT
jgi:hypothetical protein